jgi:multicomponent Na+:H+ antiporter subunit B
MNHRIRTGAFLVSAAVLLILYGWAVSGLDRFGEFRGVLGLYFNRVTVGSRHITNVPTAITFDFRAIDTMGEEYIMLGSVLGVLVLLRHMEMEHKASHHDEAGIDRISQPSDAVRLIGLVLIGALLVFGIYIVEHAQLTPGGGFQGGAILGTAALLVYLIGGYQAYARSARPEVLESLHATGAGLYVVSGMIALLFGESFLENFLPLGSIGHLLSGGSILLVNNAVGLEVANGLAVVFHEFIVQTHLERP